ncbi:MAG TPA: CHAD domain-containing protein [Acidimicrobiales bacterium]|jgi:CHAD domain-containing protein|nr:CHAD domain-containing protein [Acidimicrobiales bacterium]
MTSEMNGPSSGAVLHQVLAHSAHNFLLNDAGSASHPAAATRDPGAGANGVVVSFSVPRRRMAETERVRQTRVAMRRIRSNLRTFRLTVDPAWSTSLRAELSWYSRCLGESRDLFVLRDMLTINGPLLLPEEELKPIVDIVDQSIAGARARVEAARSGGRHARLVEELRLLQEGPRFTDKADRPANELLPTLLHRAWLDVRGAARTAKKDATIPHLHKLRVRLKGLRYGCETVSVIDGDPAQRTARAAEKLQGKLGDLLDTAHSIEWLQAVADSHPELAPSAESLLVVQRAAGAVTRRGWKDDLKDIERRWRKWQG